MTWSRRPSRARWPAAPRSGVVAAPVAGSGGGEPGARPAPPPPAHPLRGPVAARADRHRRRAGRSAARARAGPHRGPLRPARERHLRVPHRPRGAEPAAARGPAPARRVRLLGGGDRRGAGAVRGQRQDHAPPGAPGHGRLRRRPLGPDGGSRRPHARRPRALPDRRDDAGRERGRADAGRRRPLAVRRRRRVPGRARAAHRPDAGRARLRAADGQVRPEVRRARAPPRAAHGERAARPRGRGRSAARALGAALDGPGRGRAGRPHPGGPLGPGGTKGGLAPIIQAVGRSSTATILPG